MTGYFLWSQKSKLGDARDDISDLEDYSATLEENIDDLEGEVLGLEGNVEDLEENVEDLEDDLADSESTDSYLEISLSYANSEIFDLKDDVLAHEGLNASLTDELTTIKSPRHFASTSELADWLFQDDIDIVYAREDPVTKAFILMVRH